MKNYKELNNLKNCNFENSYILQIEEERDKIVFTLDAEFIQNNKHTFSTVNLIFDKVKSYYWVEKRLNPIFGKNMEVDYGNIDQFLFHEEEYLLSGEWGKILIYTSKKPYLIQI